MNNKTKRFLFFTYGSDSALILHYMLELLNKKKHDELVIVCVGSNTMRSGRNESLEKSFKAFVGSLIEKKAHLNKKLMNRISFALYDAQIDMSGVIRTEGETNTNERFELGINKISQDPNFAKYMKTLCCQELVLLGVVPSLTAFLGACRNVFYMGVCGTDLASSKLDKIRQMFDLQMDIAFSNSNKFENELIGAGIDTYGRSGGLSVRKEWIPTLEFPLEGMRKQDVIMMLDMLNITTYEIDKPEDLLQHYAAMDNSKIYMLTKIYHDMKLLHNHPKDYPSLREFIQSEELKFTDVNGKAISIESDVLREILQNEFLNLLGRATGMQDIMKFFK